MTITSLRRLATAATVATATLATLLISTQTIAAPVCGEQGVALQVLGSGGPEMRGRASASYLVWVDGKAKVLVDSGGGSALRFGESGAKVADFDAVLFSHFHSDHSADFPVLVKSSHFESPARTRAMPVFGPPGSDLMPSTSQFLDGFFAEKTGVFRYLGAGGNEMKYAFEATNVTLKPDEIKVVYDKDGLRITATPVIHAKIPSLAFKVEVKGKAITFSGDGNGNNGNLQKIAASSDVLVAHLAIDDTFHFGERSLHAPPDLIGKIAAEAQVKRLILAHRRPETLGKEVALQADMAKAYKGPMAFADDLSCYPVQ